MKRAHPLHDNDVEIRHMIVPSGALFRCIIGLGELDQDLARGRSGNPQIAISEEIAQPFAFEFSV